MAGAGFTIPTTEEGDGDGDGSEGFSTVVISPGEHPCHRCRRFLFQIDVPQLGPGLHDILTKLVKATLKCHLHTPDVVGSLSWAFETTDKPELGLGKPQDFHELLSSMEVQVISSFLSIWHNTCGYPSLSEYAESNPTPKALLALAKKIVIKHTHRMVPKDPTFADDADFSSGTSDLEDAEQDQVFQNMRVMLRDLLYVVLLKDAISDGDFGRIEDFLGVLCIWFTGAEMEQTAEEIFQFIYYLKTIWSPEFG